MNYSSIITRLVNAIVGIVQVFLGLRLVVKLFGANPSAGFVSWLYATTDPLLPPFEGMFPSPVLEGGFVVEFSALFAILIYAIFAWLVIELIEIVDVASDRRMSK